MLVHAPFAERRARRIEQVLAVVHVEDRMPARAGVISRRQPDGDVARTDVRRGHLRMFDQPAPGLVHVPGGNGFAWHGQGDEAQKG